MPLVQLLNIQSSSLRRAVDMGLSSMSASLIDPECCLLQAAVVETKSVSMTFLLQDTYRKHSVKDSLSFSLFIIFYCLWKERIINLLWYCSANETSNWDVKIQIIRKTLTTKEKTQLECVYDE